MNEIELFFKLIRLGIGHDNLNVNLNLKGEVDWGAVKALAEKQGLSAVVLDGLNSLPLKSLDAYGMPQMLRLEWIGEVLQGEQTYKLHQEVATDMANLFHRNGIRTYVLKGRIIAECYPRPEHRVSSDMDCFLSNDNDNLNRGRSHEEAWKLGNELIRSKHFDVGEGFYKNSSFHLPGLMVENHKFLTPFRGNERLESLEKVLQAMLQEDKGVDVIEGTWLYRPPVMVSALFLIEHAYSHFLHEGLTWRMVLDWVMFRKKHEKEIAWSAFEAYMDEFGFRKFYDTFNAIGMETFNDNDNLNLNEGSPEGSKSQENLNQNLSNAYLKAKMMEDIWAPLDLHESLHGVKAKFQLAGNYWRARWKYKYFTDMTWTRALMEWVTGAVFNRHPTLDS